MIKDILTERHNIMRKIKQSPHCNDKNVFRKKIKNTFFFQITALRTGVCAYMGVTLLLRFTKARM